MHHSGLDHNTPSLTVDRQLKARLIDAGCAMAPEEVVTWLGPGRVRRNIERAVEYDLRAAAFDPRASRGLRVVVPEDPEVARWHLAQFRLASGRTASAVVAIREGRPQTSLFATIEHSDADLAEHGALAAVAANLREAFGSISLTHLAAFFDRRRLASVLAEQRMRDSLHFFALPIDLLLKRTPPERVNRVTLRRVETTSPDWLAFYPQYLEAYRSFHAERPGLIKFVRVETPRDLASFADGGVLAEIFVDGRWGGLIAAMPDFVVGMHGYRIVEEIFAAEFRGQRLARALQWRLAEMLPRAGGELLLGTIHPTNVWSVRTATGMGRVDVGGYAVLDLSAPEPAPGDTGGRADASPSEHAPTS